MTWRAHLLLISVVASTLAMSLAAPAPSAAFPTSSLYDVKIAAPGIGEIATGDLDGDGRVDVVVAYEGGASLFLYYQGDGGLPAAPTTALQGAAAQRVAVADVDADGRADLVAMGSNSTTIFFQDETGFGQRTSEVPTNGARDVAVADLDGDGRADLAVLLWTQVQIWFQNASFGTWPSDQVLNLTETSGFHDLAVADLRKDGRADLILAKPRELRVYDQDQLGLDPNPVVQGLNSFGGYVSLRTKNMDGDGLPDLVISEVDGATRYGRLSVYRQEGGAFTHSVTVEGALTGLVAAGDVNDDGLADLSVVEFGPTVAVFLQRFTGGFDAVATFRLENDVPGTAAGVAVGRFSGRAFYDLILRVPDSLLLYEQEDLPPVLLRTIPSDLVFTNPGSGTALLDLRNFFDDDHGVLTFGVAFEEKPEFLHATIAADGHRVDFAAAAGWFGRARFQVAATDGVLGHGAVLSNEFAVTVNAPPVITSAPPSDLRAGEDLEYQLAVSDPYPLEDAHLFTLLEAPAGMTVDPVTGLVEWRTTGADVGTHLVRVRVSDRYGGADEQTFELRVASVPPPVPTATYAAAGAVAFLTALGLGSLASENLKYSLLLVFVPMYSKIKREQVLDHFVRGQIYGYVLANPGEHYNAIKVALHLTNGSLAHHLKTLERERFLKSKRFGLYRRFYPMHMRIPEDNFFAPNEIQKTIVDLIRGSPGITQKEISERLGLTPPTVNYHIGILSDHLAIRVERAGRKTHCFVTENGDGPVPDAPTPPASPPPSHQ